jgi:hypothetical protein
MYHYSCQPSSSRHLLLSLPLHRIHSIRGLPQLVSIPSKGPKQLIGMARVFVCVKDDEHGFQLEPEGLESSNTVPCLHFRNFNPNYHRWHSLVSETQLHQDILVPMAGYLDVKYISFTLRFQYLNGQHELQDCAGE